MQVREIMSREVCYIDPEETVAKAAREMAEKDCGFLAIGKESEGKLSGVITDRDITVRSIAEGENPEQTKVGAVQTPQVLYCFAEDSIEDAAENMRDNQVYRLIVINNAEEKQLCGVVTLGDIVRSNHTRAAERAAEGISSAQQYAA